MPPQGYTVITVPDKIKNKLKKLAKTENLSIQKFLAKLFENVEAQK